MAAQCKVCKHPEINRINEMLITGVSTVKIGKLFNLNDRAVRNHREKHLPKSLVKAQQFKEQSAANDLVERLDEIYIKAWDLLLKAEQNGSFQPAVGALREARQTTELFARVIGELKSGTTVNVLYNPEFVQVRGLIYKALLPYPEARQAVITALDDETGVIDGECEELDQT